ncbi:MAG TPA: response regulator [Vicinamibacterales bacterium]|nr:response regulator [Vicinamibacterales bacterium]
MLRAWLEELGYHVHAAADGFEGLELARQHRPPIALIDIGLPGLDGYQLARTLRETEECRDTFLVAITGYGRPEDSARAREVGFDVHLVKPVQPERLAHVIRTRRSGAPTSIAR